MKRHTISISTLSWSTDSVPGCHLDVYGQDITTKAAQNHWAHCSLFRMKHFSILCEDVRCKKEDHRSARILAHKLGSLN